MEHIQFGKITARSKQFRQPDFEAELLVGTYTGEILSIQTSRVSVTKILSIQPKATNAVMLIEKAHKGMVNCLKVSCCNETSLWIFSAGEDEYVNVWNDELQKVRSIDMRKRVLSSFPDLGLIDTTSFAVQSLDLWHPEKIFLAEQKQEDHKQLPFLMVGTRNGLLMEMDLVGPDMSFAYSKAKEENLLGVNTGFTADLLISLMQGEKIIQEDTDFVGLSMIIRSHSIDMDRRNHALAIEDEGDGEGWWLGGMRKQLSAVNPQHPYIVIVDCNDQVAVWNFEKFHLVTSKDLRDQSKGPVTSVAWHPLGTLLLLGFYSGETSIFELRDSSEDQKLPLRLQYGRQMQLFQLSYLQPAAEAPVLSIEFNPDGSLLAASYCLVASGADSFVQVYVHREAAEQEGVVSDEPNLYLRYFEIRSPSLRANYPGRAGACGMAVYSMSFTADSKYLMACFQLVEATLRPRPSAREGVYVLWDIKLNNTIKTWEGQKNASFSKVKFSNHLRGRLRLFQTSLKSDQRNYLEQPQGDRQVGQPPSIYSRICSQVIVVPALYSTVCQAAGLAANTPLFLGDTVGLIHIAGLGMLHAPEDPRDIEERRIFLQSNPPKHVLPWRMHQAIVIPAHCSSVVWAELSPDGGYLFTRGELDCISMWRVSTSRETEELDYKSFEQPKEDALFGEVPSREKLTYCLQDVIPTRELVQKVRDALPNDEGEIHLKIRRAIGRNSFHSRNTLCCALDDRLIFPTGSILTKLAVPPPHEIMRTKYQEELFWQSYLSPTNPNNIEISSFALCPAERLLCVGTFEKEAQLIFWDCVTHSNLGNCMLPGFVKVLSCVFSPEGRTLAAVCLSSDYSTSVILFDCHRFELIGRVDLLKSLVVKVRGILFLAGPHTFITFGVVHLRLWQVRDSGLQGRGLEIQTSAGAAHQTTDTDDEVEESDGLPTFLSAVVVDKVILLAADDGAIYVYQDLRPSYRLPATTGIPIICIAASKNAKKPFLFASGSLDGRVLLWELNRESGGEIRITQLKEFPLGFGAAPNASLTDPRLQVQSLLFRGQNLIVGTRSGGVTYLSLDIPEELKNKDPDIRDHIYPVYEPTDHQVPCEVCFDRSGNRIYSLSLRGEFVIWKLQPLEMKLKQVIGEDSVRLISLRTVDFVFCIFSREVVGLLVDQNSTSVEKNASLSRPFIREISDARVNIEDSLLSVAFLEDADEFPSIRIFRIDWDKGLDFLCSIEDLTSPVEVMDFTIDDTLLMFKEAQGQRVFFDLQTQRKIDTLGQPFDPEFLTTGLHLSESVQHLAEFQTPKMLFDIMVRVGNKSVLVGDSLGGLQIFPFPINQFPGNKLYSEHLADIRSISLTLDRKRAVTTSTYDR